MNTIINGLKAQFGDDVVVEKISKDFVQLSYVGSYVKAWEASAESCTGCGQNCYFLGGVLTVLTTDVQELLNEKFFGKIREFGFESLAERTLKAIGTTTAFGSTAGELAVLSIVGGMLAVPDFVPEYDNDTAKLILGQMFSEPTEEQVAEFMRTNQLLKQYEDAKAALKAANFDLQCAIDNGNEDWEHGCRNSVFKQETIMRKTLAELHA